MGFFRLVLVEQVAHRPSRNRDFDKAEGGLLNRLAV
jgi:hypothetical protein